MLLLLSLLLVAPARAQAPQCDALVRALTAQGGPVEAFERRAWDLIEQAPTAICRSSLGTMAAERLLSIAPEESDLAISFVEIAEESPSAETARVAAMSRTWLLNQRSHEYPPACTVAKDPEALPPELRVELRRTADAWVRALWYGLSDRRYTRARDADVEQVAAAALRFALQHLSHKSCVPGALAWASLVEVARLAVLVRGLSTSDVAGDADKSPCRALGYNPEAMRARELRVWRALAAALPASPSKEGSGLAQVLLTRVELWDRQHADALGLDLLGDRYGCGPSATGGDTCPLALPGRYPRALAAFLGSVPPDGAPSGVSSAWTAALPMVADQVSRAMLLSGKAGEAPTPGLEDARAIASAHLALLAQDRIARDAGASTSMGSITLEMAAAQSQWSLYRALDGQATSANREVSLEPLTDWLGVPNTSPFVTATPSLLGTIGLADHAWYVAQRLTVGGAFRSQLLLTLGRVHPLFTVRQRALAEVVKGSERWISSCAPERAEATDGGQDYLRDGPGYLMRQLAAQQLLEPGGAVGGTLLVSADQKPTRPLVDVSTARGLEQWLRVARAQSSVTLGSQSCADLETIQRQLGQLDARDLQAEVSEFLRDARRGHCDAPKRGAGALADTEAASVQGGEIEARIDVVGAWLKMLQELASASSGAAPRLAVREGVTLAIRALGSAARATSLESSGFGDDTRMKLIKAAGEGADVLCVVESAESALGLSTAGGGDVRPVCGTAGWTGVGSGDLLLRDVVLAGGAWRVVGFTAPDLDGQIDPDELSAWYWDAWRAGADEAWGSFNDVPVPVAGPFSIHLEERVARSDPTRLIDTPRQRRCDLGSGLSGVTEVGGGRVEIVLRPDEPDSLPRCEDVYQAGDR